MKKMLSYIKLSALFHDKWVGQGAFFSYLVPFSLLLILLVCVGGCRLPTVDVAKGSRGEVAQATRLTPQPQVVETIEEFPEEGVVVEELTPPVDVVGVEQGVNEEVVAPEAMSYIPGATFTRGIDDDPHKCDMYQQPRDGKSAATPAMKVTVDPFLIDKYEVTNADFARCVAAKKCRKEAGPRYADFNHPRQPITGVSWYDAVVYCQFRGKRLPTEAEWELAARGAEGDLYPWGNQPPTCDLTVIKDSRGRSCGELKRRGSNPASGRVLEVGSRPAGRFGLYDMAGNAQEWVADWWTPNYTLCGSACAGRNPKGPCDAAEPCKGYTYRVVRGGSWYWDASHTTGYHRRRHHPNNHPYHHFGFRCAAEVEQLETITKIDREIDETSKAKNLDHGGK